MHMRRQHALPVVRANHLQQMVTTTYVPPVLAALKALQVARKKNAQMM
jgi:hypothetical protein